VSVVLDKAVFLLVGYVCLASAPIALGDSLAWAPRVDTLEKADYSMYRATRADGGGVTFKLSHVGPLPGLFTLFEVGVGALG
jgi:hypothetical protein